MREILFRGKQPFSGKWVEGFYVHIPWGRGGADEHLIQTIKPDGSIGMFHTINPNSLGQYTGLNDKNGKKIFEGDRIEIRGYVYYCCWDEGNLEYILINEKESFGMGYAASSRMTVIGNVHDNPELLEVDDGESNL